MSKENLYLISKLDNRTSALYDYRSFFSAHGWDVFSIPKIHYDVFKKFDIKYFEIDRTLALGFKSFGDARSEIKVSTSDSEELFSYEDTLNQSPKVKIPVTETRYNSILNAMKLFAKILLEEEYNKRYKKLNYDSCELEIRTWERQLNEVDKYKLGESTPFLSKLSLEKEIDISELVSSIENSKKNHDEKVDNLFIELQKHKFKFKSATTIEELNWLYMDYFNIKGVFSKQYIDENSELFTPQGEAKKRLGVGYNF